jgi:predicted GNAT family acetyltransferase
MDVEVTDNPEEHRYEVRADGALAGSTVYRERPGLIVFVHTEVDDRFEGQGLASKLTRTALEDARDRELQVLPFCPFVNGYIQRHREYTELVPEAFRARFGL